MNESNKRVLYPEALAASMLINFLITLITYLCLGHYFIYQAIPKAFIAMCLTYIVGWVLELSEGNLDLYNKTSDKPIDTNYAIGLAIYLSLWCFCFMLGRGITHSWRGAFYAGGAISIIPVFVNMLRLIYKPQWKSSIISLKNFLKNYSKIRSQRKQEQKLMQEEKAQQDAKLNHSRMVDL